MTRHFLKVLNWKSSHDNINWLITRLLLALILFRYKNLNYKLRDSFLLNSKYSILTYFSNENTIII